MRFGRVANFEARQQPELNRLPHQRECAGNNRLAGDHCRRRRKADQRHKNLFRHHAIEWILDGFRMRQHQGSLPEIIQQQARQHEIEPCRLDRLAAEVTEIGIERLATRHRQKHRAQNHQADHAMSQQKLDGEDGIHRMHDARVVTDMHQPHNAKRQKPDDHDGTKSAGHQRRSTALHREQTEQNEDRQRHHIVFQRRGREFQTFHG